ncbi:FAD-dependent monooxygenase [Actinophytocola sp.]|uniref:FAD-dependent monooxygenase n=1 Tax=Actinophytocola sp. TaxID=1872138 RepID=UPI003D6C4CE8
MSGELTVAVVGAGIAGLTLAAALRQAGIDCEVYEQAPHLAEVGAGIQVSPNGSRLLHRLGLSGGLAKVAVRPGAIQVRHGHDGSAITATTLGPACEQIYGSPYYTLHRSDLHQTLLESLPLGMVHLGRRCVGVVEHGDRVELEFADSTRVGADLVIGADGIRSAIRRHLTNDAPRFSGHCVYRGLVPAERTGDLFADPRVLIWMGPGQHCVAYPVSGGRQVSIAASAPSREWLADSWSLPGRAEELLAAYSGWAPEVTDLLSTVTEPSRWALYDRTPALHLRSRRIALIGDAAHPVLPFGAQGASLAMEDAFVLADRLATATSSTVEDAVADYEATRRPRVKQVREFVADNEESHHVADLARQRGRDERLREDWGLRSRAWLFGYDAVTAKAS